jgi:hypothetical protein
MPIVGSWHTLTQLWLQMLAAASGSCSGNRTELGVQNLDSLLQSTPNKLASLGKICLFGFHPPICQKESWARRLQMSFLHQQVSLEGHGDGQEPQHNQTHISIARQLEK